MKRSEAINIIANRIYELGVEPDETTEEADSILAALENAGMVPPNIAVDPYDSFNIWEKEDED